MTVSAERFRSVLGSLAGGVCVIASRDAEGRPHGLTATAVCSASLEPPLVLVCLGSGSRTHDAIRTSGVFSVTFLGVPETAIAERFAGKEEDKFRGLETQDAATGAPVLETGLGYCDCVAIEELAAGDHTVFIGRVEAAELSDRADASAPLIRYRGAYVTGKADVEPRVNQGPDANRNPDADRT